MQSEDYRSALHDALKTLVSANKKIMEDIVQLAMLGELQDWSNSVPVGEVHEFDFDLFQGVSDVNVQALVAVIEKIDATYDSICNLNKIDPEEPPGEEQ